MDPLGRSGSPKVMKWILLLDCDPFVLEWPNPNSMVVATLQLGHSGTQRWLDHMLSLTILCHFPSIPHYNQPVSYTP